MHTTKSLLDALKDKHALRSDYALAKFLNVTQPSVGRWRDGGSLNDENAIRIADLLDLPRAYVLACMGAERAPEDTESSFVWRQIADVFQHRVALWLAVSLLGFAAILQNQAAVAAPSTTRCMYIMVNRRLRSCERRHSLRRMVRRRATRLPQSLNHRRATRRSRTAA